MKSVEVKLRKYQRIKRKAKRSEKFDRFARLYWRYHFKFYGPHVPLWGQP
jgi:hypothetical protein